MKVLVTGTEGYLGCLLAPELLRDGHEVVGVDTGFYKAGWLYHGVDATPLHARQGHPAHRPSTTSRASTPSCTWPSCPTTRSASCRRRSPTRSTTRARCGWPSWPSRPASPRFVYMSSCSVYGVADGEVDETSPVNPQTAYAECKTLVERDLTADGRRRLLARPSCATRPPSAPRRGCASTSCSTTSSGLAWTDEDRSR